MSDISKPDWTANDVVKAIDDHYTQDSDDPEFYHCDRCGRKLYVNYEGNQERIPVPATLSQITAHERTGCPNQDDTE